LTANDGKNAILIAFEIATWPAAGRGRDALPGHLLDLDRGRELFGVTLRLEAAFLRLRLLRRPVTNHVSFCAR
jgi:hypothetical protein